MLLNLFELKKKKDFKCWLFKLLDILKYKWIIFDDDDTQRTASAQQHFNRSAIASQPC